MALQASFNAWTWNRVHITQCSGEQEESSKFKEATSGTLGSPAKQFAPLATRFQRRLLVGVGSASLVAVGANFGGITSFLLGLSPEKGRNLKLDVLYPIQGYSRCIDTREGFGNLLTTLIDHFIENGYI